jgi:hypothetical protein
MLLLVISVGVFVLALAGFVTMLGLWTYADAKVRTDRPAVWTLIVLLVPNLLGLVIYLLVGRTKMKRSEGRFKRPLIAFAVGFVLASGLMIGGCVNLLMTDGGDLPTWSGVSIGRVENYWDRQWTVSFKASGEEMSKTFSLSDEELAAFRVTGNCDSGRLYLRISQGEIATIVDISDSFNGPVDLSAFQAGKLKLLILNDEAKNASIVVSWQG